MHPFAAEWFRILETLHGEIEQALDGLPQTALDWSPGPEINSLAVLVTHIAGAERYWVGDVVAQEPSGRDRPAEFQTRGLDAAALQVRLAGVLAYTRGVFERLALDDLDAVRVSPRDGREFTVAWCLGHVLEHTALHTGHIQLTRQWWEAAAHRQDGAAG